MRKRADQSEMDRRRDDIHALLDKGFRASEIAKIIAQHYNVLIRQAYKDVQQVIDERERCLGDASMEILLGETYKKNEHIYRVAMRKDPPDLQAASRALQDNMKISQQLDNYRRRSSVNNRPLTDYSSALVAGFEALCEPDSDQEPQGETP